MNTEVFYEISVVLALNKIDKYAFKAIDSVVNQNGVDHEVVLVVNGPMADSISKQLYLRYLNNDNVQILTTSVPQLAYSLNLGVSKANSELIARMDADDIAMPERLSKQLAFMSENRLDLLGTGVLLIDENDEIIGSRSFPTTKKGIKNKIVRGSPFCHPSVIYTKELFFKARGYNAGFNSEDYDLWLRFLRFEPNWSNMSDKLLKYRIHTEASQGSWLAYCEVSGHFYREFLLNPSFSLFLGVCFSTYKTFHVRLRNFLK